MTTTRLGALSSDTTLLDTDNTLAGNSDARVPTQKAVKGYVDTASGLLIPTSAKGAASGVASLDASSRLVESPADLAVLPRHLSDLARGGWLPGGAIAETFPREFMLNALSLATGRLQLAGGVVIPGGRSVSTISVPSHTTPGSGMTNQWFCLVDRSGNVLAKTGDDTSTAWAASTVKTLTISGGYTPTNAIEVYIGVVVVGTPPTLWRPGSAASFAVGTGGGIGDSSTTGLTNPASLGGTCAVPNGQAAFYAFVS